MQKQKKISFFWKNTLFLMIYYPCNIKKTKIFQCFGISIKFQTFLHHKNVKIIKINLAVHICDFFKKIISDFFCKNIHMRQNWPQKAAWSLKIRYFLYKIQHSKLFGLSNDTKIKSIALKVTEICFVEDGLLTNFPKIKYIQK